MSKFVIELQKSCLDSTILCSDILQKAYFLAKKLGVNKWENFCSLEMNGYNDSSEKIPNYRYVDVQYEFYNPYHGWMPVVIKKGLGFDSLLSRPIASSIIELEELYKSTELKLSLPLSVEIQELLNRAAQMPVMLQIMGFFEKTRLINIFQEVRKIILDWAIELEKKGILGEEFMFTEKEKETAKTVSTITINGNISGANIIGALQNSTVNIDTPLDFYKIENLIKQISDNIQNIDLNNDDKQSLIYDIAKVRDALEKKDSLKIITFLTDIKNLCISVAGSIIASGIVQQISGLLP